MFEGVLSPEDFQLWEKFWSQQIEQMNVLDRTGVGLRRRERSLSHVTSDVLQKSL